MKIRSHVSVDGFAFGAARATLMADTSSAKVRKNRLGEEELDCGGIVYRFAADAFVEASFPLPATLSLDGQQIEGASLIAYLRRHDPEYREAHGFAVAPTLGLAVDLDHEEHWTTAFAAGRWDGVR